CMACRPSASPVRRTLSAGGRAATGAERSSPARTAVAAVDASSAGRTGGPAPSILVVMEMLLVARSDPVTAPRGLTLAASTHDLDHASLHYPAADDAARLPVFNRYGSARRRPPQRAPRHPDLDAAGPRDQHDRVAAAQHRPFDHVVGSRRGTRGKATVGGLADKRRRIGEAVTGAGHVAPAHRQHVGGDGLAGLHRPGLL